METDVFHAKELNDNPSLWSSYKGKAGQIEIELITYNK